MSRIGTNSPQSKMSRVSTRFGPIENPTGKIWHEQQPSRFICGEVLQLMLMLPPELRRRDADAATKHPREKILVSKTGGPSDTRDRSFGVD